MGGRGGVKFSDVYRVGIITERSRGGGGGGRCVPSFSYFCPSLLCCAIGVDVYIGP